MEFAIPSNLDKLGGGDIEHVKVAMRYIYPPSQKATGVNPWMNARRVSSVALAKDDTLRRVAPDEACGGCHGRKPVELH